MLNTEYYVYFMELSEPERAKQAFIILIFLDIVILAGIISKFIKEKKQGNK